MTRPHWWILAATTLVTAVVTTAVTLASAGLGPLWRAVFPERPISVHAERFQPPRSPSPAAAGRPRPIRAAAVDQDDWARYAWALPGLAAPAEVPRPDRDDYAPEGAISDWAAKAGGGDIGSTRIRITVTGQDKDVVIDGVCAHLVGPRAAPLDGTLVYWGPEAEEPEPATVDLDVDRSCSPEVSRAPVHVEAHKNIVIDLSAFTRGHSVTWYPELRLVVDGARVVVPIRQDKPYRTTALLDDLGKYQRFIVFGPSFGGFH